MRLGPRADSACDLEGCRRRQSGRVEADSADVGSAQNDCKGLGMVVQQGVEIVKSAK